MSLLQAAFTSHEAFLAAWQAELSRGGLLVRGASLAGAAAGAPVTLSVQVAGAPAVEVPARVAAVVPGVGVAVLLDGVPPALARLATEPPTAEDRDEATDDAPPPPGPLVERLKKLTVTEKMQLALSGTRDERAMLLRDSNKTLHVFVLKNPRLGLDEVQAAARLPQLSPEAIKQIAEHREWGTNATVCAALVRNPKTPLPLALRLIDRVPLSDLRAIAKGGARDAVVHAARKKLAG